MGKGEGAKGEAIAAEKTQDECGSQAEDFSCRKSAVGKGQSGKEIEIAGVFFRSVAAIRETIRRLPRWLPRAAVLGAGNPFHSEPAHIRGRAGCGAYAV